MRRVVLCEGPADLAALRELAILFYSARTEKSSHAAGPAGEQRRQTLSIGTSRIEIIVPRDAKAGLGRALAAQLEGLAKGVLPDEEEALECIAVLFDPDEQAVEYFHKELSHKVIKDAPSWKLDGKDGAWIASRDPGETVKVLAIPWRAPGPVVDDLPDRQSLDRLLCAVAARSFPDESKTVERWLGELVTAAKRPGWKAALHLWCAIVEEKASESNAAARFLHQNLQCRPNVRPILEEVSLLRDLGFAFGVEVT